MEAAITRIRLLACLGFVALLPAVAQTAQPDAPIDAAAAAQHLTAPIQLHMPPIARLAHMVGIVQLAFTIDKEGRPESVTATSGPEMLQGAAVDDVIDAVYRPFLRDGQPVAVKTTIALNYKDYSSPSRKYTPVEVAYEHASAACVEATHDNKPPAKLAPLCVTAARAADALVPPAARHWPRDHTYLLAATALLHNDQPTDALLEANHAVEASGARGTALPQAAAAYVTRAQIQITLKNLHAADEDLTQAENREQEALRLFTAVPQTGLSQTLKRIFTLHAQVLAALGNATGAQEKTAAASRL